MRLGIFGGSFDPVHFGHIQLADCCSEQAGLDQVWFVPAAQQPLKPAGPVASNSHRLEMLRHACAHQRNLIVSTLEIDRGGVSYSIDTLEAIHASQPQAELFFLMGADSLADMPDWHRPADICRLATPLVVHRAETAKPDFDVLREYASAERIEQIRKSQVEMPPTPISSSGIRSLIAEGKDWQSNVPRAVAAYIREHQLYAPRASSSQH